MLLQRLNTLIMIAVMLAFFPTTAFAVPVEGEAPVVVEIPDENFAIALREALNEQQIPIGNDESITDAHLAELTYLNLYSKNVLDLTGIEYCSKLANLDLEGNYLGTLEKLSSLTNLTALTVSSTGIDSLEPLANLANLQFLTAMYNTISDLTPLSGLTGLFSVNICFNQVSDFAPLLKCMKIAGSKVSASGNPLGPQTEDQVAALLASRVLVDLDLPCSRLELELVGQGKVSLGLYRMIGGGVYYFRIGYVGLRHMAAENWHFVEWQSPSSITPTGQLYLTADTTLRAVFELDIAPEGSLEGAVEGGPIEGAVEGGAIEGAVEGGAIEGAVEGEGEEGMPPDGESPASIDWVAPATGWTFGGTPVLIKVSGFPGKPDVYFGDVLSPGVGWADEEAGVLVARSPEHDAGTVNLSLTLDGVSASRADAYTFLAAGGLACTVKDIHSNQLIAGATVRITPGNRSISKPNDAGIYAFVLLPAHTYTVYVSAPGYLPSQTNNVTVNDRQTLAIDIPLDEIEDIPVDSDGDGLTDVAELETHGTDPANSDSDLDGMTDGYEVKFGLNPKSAEDRDRDQDWDGLSNWEEFLGGSNPADATSPRPVFILSPEGSDDSGDGSRENPWRTFSHAREQVVAQYAGSPVTFLLVEGEYDGDIELAPYWTLRGKGAGAVIHGHIRGAEHAAVFNVSIDADAETPLLTIPQSPMEIRNVTFHSGGVGILLGEGGLEQSVIDHCEFLTLETGIIVEGLPPLLRRCTFDGSLIANYAIEFRAGATAYTATSSSATDGNSGFNRFEGFGTGHLPIYNERAEAITIQNNYWGKDDTNPLLEEIVDGQTSVVVIEPVLKKSSGLVPSSLYCKVWDATSESSLNNATLKMSQGNFGSPAAKDGVYAYVCLPPGSYGVGALVTGYADQSKSASLASGETKSLMFPMTKPSVEGDVEGGLPVEGPVVTEGDTSGETGAEGEDSPPTRRGCFG